MEIFVDIENTNGKYKISNKGVLIRINKKYPPTVMKGWVNSSGYRMVSYTTLDDKRNEQLLHRLLGKYFLDNQENKPCINHIDGNKLNNSLDNLEWCTYSENNKHAFDIGLKVNTTKKKVKQSTIGGKLVKIHDSIMSASKEIGISRANIHRQIKRGRKSAGGFIWDYA